MNELEAGEQAYKNGFSDGFEAGRRSVSDGAKHGHWIRKSGKTFCSECMVSGSPEWKVCPVCEAKMYLPKITDETKKALEAMDMKAHGGGEDG